MTAAAKLGCYEVIAQIGATGFVDGARDNELKRLVPTGK
jgi:hypothetical protein